MPARKPVVTTSLSNPYAALAACLKAARWAGWTDQQIRDFRLKATGGKLQDIVPACREHFTLV